jgi:hypothetical protein
MSGRTPRAPAPLPARWVARKRRLLAGVALALGAGAALAVMGGWIASQPGDGRGPPASSFALSRLADHAAARSDRRPMAAGVYDPAVETTFVSWAGRDEDNFIQAYDHRTRRWSPPVKVGDGLGDAHNYPTLIQAADGHLLVFRGIHNQRLELSRSPRPHSLEGVWTRAIVAEGANATYPMPVRTADGALFVFFRETVWFRDASVPRDTRPILYARSMDDGRTWQASRALTGRPFAIGSLHRADNMNEIYVGQMRLAPARPGRPERILMVYTLAGGGPGQHQHDRYHRNIYFAAFDPANLHFYSAAGHDMGTQVDDAGQERDLKVAETPLGRQWWAKSPSYVHLVGALGDGRPFVVWFTVDDLARLRDHMAVWRGEGWECSQPARDLLLMDMERLDASTWRLYAAPFALFRFPSHTKPGLETLLIRDGRGWSPESRVVMDRPVQRAEVIEGFRDPVRVLITGASSSRWVGRADGDVLAGGESAEQRGSPFESRGHETGASSLSVQ